MSLRIAIDFDDFLTLFLDKTINKINFLYDKDYKIDDIKGWNMLDYIDITEQELFNVWTEKFVENVPFRYGAKAMIDELKSRGHEVVIATALWSPYHQSRENICIEQLGLKSEDIIFIKKKYLLDVDILMDDKLDNFLNENGLPCKFDKIVYDMPHNQDSSRIGLHYRIDSLKDVIKIVDTIERRMNNEN